MPLHGVASLPQSMGLKPGWPEPLSRMDPARRGFTLALIASLAFHAVLLSIHFKLPDKVSRVTKETLEVVLVNAKSARKPDKAQARAQANLDGGGNTDENRRAKTPLPAAQQVQPGDSLMEAQRRVQELEVQQQRLLAQAKSKQAIQAESRRAEVQPEQPSLRGADLAQSALAIARMEAQIERQIEEYNKRPRKKNIGTRAEEYRFAQYVEDWRLKVERVGTLNYPEAARGKLYGALVLSVTLQSDGSVQKIEINRSSGHKVLDDAARRIVQMASPYSPFPPDIRRDTDILEITRTWTFTRNDALETR